MGISSHETAVKPKQHRRLLIVVGLVVFSFMSTSYAASDTNGGRCASSFKELAKHPEAGGKCSPDELRGLIRRLSQRSWTGPFGYRLQFQMPSDAFFIIVNGKKKFDNICCRSGVWSLPGHGNVSVRGNTLTVGQHQFNAEQHSQARPLVQMADASQGRN